MSRIKLTDNTRDVLVKMSDGNPGAISCMVEIMKNGDRIDETFNLLDPPTSADEIEKEKKLRALFQAMTDGQTECYSLAKTENIEEGCQLLVDIFRMGGF